MIYNSSTHGSMEIAEMPQPHVVNALRKLTRLKSRSYLQEQLIGALTQSLKERELRPSIQPSEMKVLKKDMDLLRQEVKNSVSFRKGLHNALNNY